jgi:hypothetical protein
MRRRHLFSKLLLAALLAFCVFASFWLGLVPQRYSPFAPLSLDDPPRWFVDARLATLRREPAYCRVLLKPPHVVASPAAEQPIVNGCGWSNAFRVAEVAGARLSIDKLSCEATAALALWLEREVQPLARQMLGSPVVEIRHYGGYNCRNIAGNVFWKDVRSQHATANAIDIAGFTLADGRTVSVAKGWPGNGPEGRFLRAAHGAACAYFRVAIGPDFNAAHRDHFHLDRGPMWRCR